MTRTPPSPDALPALRARYQKAGQAHVWRFWETLDADRQARFAQQLQAIDLDQVAAFAARIASDSAGARAAAGAGIELHPPAVTRPTPLAREAAAARGAELLGAGRAAVLVVAGGQATRLGVDYPKGCYAIGALSGQSLFENLARKVRAASARARSTARLILLTSPDNHEATVGFFVAREYFGLDRDRVHFVTQGTVPALDLAGRLVLSAPDRVFVNPDGHGGAIPALLRAGLLDTLQREGVTALSVVQVDNYQARLLDPVFLGLHEAQRSEFSVKTVPKTEPREKVGVFALADGACRVIEYSELPEALAERQAADGRLAFGAGNAALYLIDVAFARRLAEDEAALPFHRADKALPGLDAGGRPLAPPRAPNGVKFERFLFDLLAAAKNPLLLEIERRAEFAPVKNATGVDSPDSARAQHAAYFASGLEAAGHAVPRDAKGSPTVALEVDPLVAETPEALTAALLGGSACVIPAEAGGMLVVPADAAEHPAISANPAPAAEAPAAEAPAVGSTQAGGRR